MINTILLAGCVAGAIAEAAQEDGYRNKTLIINRAFELLEELEIQTKQRHLNLSHE